MKKYVPVCKLLALEMGLLLFVVSMHSLGIPVYCPFKMITGIPCPGCGGQRALFAILHGNIAEAVYINPLSVAVICFAIIAPIWLFADCYRSTNSLNSVMKGKWSLPTSALVAIVVIANWIWNIYKGL